MAVALAAAVIAVAPACGRPPVQAEAEAPVASTDPSRVRGSWPPPTTAPPTTTTIPGDPDDPNAGLGIAEPIGPPFPTSFTVADSIVPRLGLYQAPGVPVPSHRQLDDPSWEGLPLVFLVREERADWLRVQVPSRPNGATAWIQRKDVELRTVPNHVLIERGAKRLTVFHGDVPIFVADAAVGKASSPTPLGNFYVDGLAQPPNPNTAYGAFQVSFTGYSEVYDTFGRGNGQVAAHGTNRPELIGTPASNGCVRLTNEDVTTLVGLAPTGTPVRVVA